MIISDPVFGFIEIPEGFIKSLVKHPFVTRLTRIKQLGPISYVYPGGQHTRFQHSIGTLHLVTKAIESLSKKGYIFLEKEEIGVKAAMLLHDIGHSPMSHTLEQCFTKGISHEDISLMLMKHINKELNGELDTAINIFENTYPKHCLHELICSQLDMDRMDYLCRDSFFTGVREGNIGVARIVKMLNIVDDHLLVDAKGIYTIENYLMSRRLMYWQVYLHKTGLAAQELLIMIFKRAKQLIQQGHNILATESLMYHLKNDIDKEFASNHPEFIQHFTNIDDSDIITALKQWQHCDDKVLALLSNNYINRNLYKIKEISNTNSKEIEKLQQEVANKLDIPIEDAEYFVRTKSVSQMLYSTTNDHIHVLQKDGTTKDISECSELLSTEMVDRLTTRQYLFTQRFN